jgi:hypothetical protein
LFGAFADGDRFAGEEGFVGLEVGGFAKDGVGRDAVAFGQQHDVAGDDFGAGDALFCAVSDDERAGAGEVLQGGQSALCAAFLDDDEDDVQDGEGLEDEGFGEVAQEKVDDSGCEEKLEHRLLDGVADDADGAAFLLLREGVGAIVVQALGGFG